MERRFSAFGQVLDIGFIKYGECFVGHGYVVLNLNPINAVVESFEKLSRVIDWIDDQRDLLLTWEEIPPYYRFCQKEDHCRADCQELLKSKHCFNCNEKGHIIRRNYNPPIAVHKRISIQTRSISARGEPIQQQHSVTQVINTAPAAENRAPSKAIDERPNKHTPVDRPTLSVVEAQSSRSEGPAHIAKKSPT